MSAFTGRPTRGDLAITGETTSLGPSASGRRYRGEGAGRTSADLRATSCRGGTAGRSTRTTATTRGARSPSTYVTWVDDLLELALRWAPAEDHAAAATPSGCVS